MTLLAHLQAHFDAVAARRGQDSTTTVLPLAAETSIDDAQIATTLLICTPASFRPAAPVPGLRVVVLTSQSPIADIQENMDANERGFDPHSAPISEQAARAFRAELAEGRAFTAKLNGEPVAAGMFIAPIDGIAEPAGIATLVPYRGRGIGGALTSEIVRVAFVMGVHTAILSTDNPVAYRVYRRIGFEPVATLAPIQ
jgi:GNAT superfamily N-acetyltransferase